VLEINPVTLEIVWQYTARTAGFVPVAEDSKFFSHYASGAQRLPNGNTLIVETAYGRIFEVTPQSEIVWEFLNPFNHNAKAPAWEPERPDGELSTKAFSNYIYRAYRLPYDWVPQLERPVEEAVIPPANGEFRVSP
jgi:hypothetical protein